MQLADDPDMAAWLFQFGGQPDEFDWDAGNLTKHRKHQVEPDDVESLFHYPYIFAGRITEPEHDEARWLVLGQNRQERRLTLIFTQRGRKLRPISCRAMRKNERKLYEEIFQEPDTPPAAGRTT